MTGNLQLVTGKLIMSEASLGPRRKVFYSSFSPAKMLYWVVARSLVGGGTVL